MPAPHLSPYPQHPGRSEGCEMETPQGERDQGPYQLPEEADGGDGEKL